MSGAVDTLQSRVAIQRSLNRLEKLTSGNLQKFSKCKCQVQHSKQNNFLQQCRLGASWLESSFAEKYLRVLVDKLNISQLYALVAKANGIASWAALGGLYQQVEGG